MPDLDYEKIALNKKQMISEFIKLHSAFKEEEEVLEGTPSKGPKVRTSSMNLVAPGNSGAKMTRQITK